MKENIEIKTGSQTPGKLTLNQEVWQVGSRQLFAQNYCSPLQFALTACLVALVPHLPGHQKASLYRYL